MGILKLVGVDHDHYGTKCVLSSLNLLKLPFDFELSKVCSCSSGRKNNAFSELYPAVTLHLPSLGSFCGHISIINNLLHQVIQPNSELQLFEISDITSWIEFFNCRFACTLYDKTYPKVDASSSCFVAKTLLAMNLYLETTTFLVSERITPADVVLGLTIQHLLEADRLDQAFLDGLLNLSRHKRTVEAHVALTDVLKAALEQVQAIHNLDILAKSGKFDQSQNIENFEKLDKIHKVDKNEKNDKIDKVDKVEKNEKTDKSEKADKSDRSDAGAQWLDKWKKVYSNAKGDLYAEVLPTLRESFDPKELSIFYMKYNKLEDELTNAIYSSNMLSGFLQRFETDFRHHSFGVIHVLGEGKEFDIEGVWIIRGQELTKHVIEHPSYEFQTFRKLDLTKDWEMIAEFLCSESKVGGRAIADTKVWK